MPKKTRQAKIIAQLRRLRNTQNSTSTEVEEQKTTVPNKDPKTIVEKTESQATTTTVHNYSYVFGDLKKTFIFTVAAVVFQIVLSFLVKNWV